MVEQLLTGLHEARKLENGYTREEVDRMRLSLAGVLVPLTVVEKEQLLRQAGFVDVECIWLAIAQLRYLGRPREGAAPRPHELAQDSGAGQRRGWAMHPGVHLSVRHADAGGAPRAVMGTAELGVCPRGLAVSPRQSIAGWEGSNVAEAYRRKRPEVLEILRGNRPLAFPTSSLLPWGDAGFVTATRSSRSGTSLRLPAGTGSACRSSIGEAVSAFITTLAGLLVPGLELDYHVQEIPRSARSG